jgi:hypothetical protein
MPPKNGVGRDDRGDLTEATTTQPVTVPRQPPAFFIGQPDPAAQLAAEDAILFDYVGDGILLTLVEPADQRREEHSEGERVEHGGRVYDLPPSAATRIVRGPRV